MWLRRMSVAVLVLVAGCSASTTGPGGSSGPSSANSSTVWNGTDLLWDAIGEGAGFTAVGNSGVVVTSGDGGLWQQQKTVTPQTLRGIASDGKSTVAVGTGGTVVSWPAGEPGAAQVSYSGVPITLLGIADGGGTWVTGGSGGTVLTSTDLHSWDEHSTGTDGDIFAIAYGAGHFVAVTDIGSIITSTNGISWTSTRAADGLWLWGATYGVDGFIAVGANGTVLQSPDGLTWSPRTSGTTQVLRGVTYGHGQYFAVGSDSVAVVSPDGVTWTAVNVGDEGVELWRPASDPAGWLAVGAGGTRLVSADLHAWSGGKSTRTAFYGVGSDGTTVLASGVNGTVARRGSSGVWETVATAPGRRELRSVTHLDSTWVVTGGGGTIMTSPDGTSFTARSSGSKAELWSSALSNTGTSRIVVVGAGGAILVSDDRGQTWRAATDPQKNTLFSVTYGPAGFVAVGVDGAIVRSPDGLAWTTVVAGGGQTLRAVSSGSVAPADALGAPTYVTVGASGTMLTSGDGEHWQHLPAVTRLTLRGIVDIDYNWIAVGGGGIVLQSTDEHSWKVVRSGTVSELFAVTEQGTNGCGAIAVAGVDASITSSTCGATWTLAP
ncbi:MAG TPA: hypothetical protein VHX15_13485 [Frankiaceae bacterium]|nr:hypothetical protein [Frankiaceae bacterium]